MAPDEPPPADADDLILLTGVRDVWPNVLFAVVFLGNRPRA
jgi:hypothetical protein